MYRPNSETGVPLKPELRVSILSRLNDYLLYMGIPGLFAISFVDSAAMPLAGGPDAVILLLSWQQPSMVLLIVLAATVGSTLGCLVPYGIGRKGGEKALSRFSPGKREWVERKMQDYGIWIIIAAVIAPPPFPTKLLILAAGVLRTSKIQLISGVFIGRSVRYAVLGYLGAEFGDEAARLIEENYLALSLALVAGLLLIILIRSFRKRVLNKNTVAR